MRPLRVVEMVAGEPPRGVETGTASVPFFADVGFCDGKSKERPRAALLSAGRVASFGLQRCTPNSPTKVTNR